MFGNMLKTRRRHDRKPARESRRLHLVVEKLEDRLVPAAFTPGSLAILQADDSSTNTTVSIVEVNPSVAGQTPTNVIAIDGTGPNAMRFSGSATSTGYVSRTDDGTLFTFNGVNSDETTGNVNAKNPRAVGTLDPTGGFAIQTTYTAIVSGGPQTRSSTSLDNTNWFIADQGGLYTNNGTAPSPAANLRAVKSFGGIVYVGQQSGTAANIQVSTVSAPSGGTITGLLGLTNNGSFQDFYLISSGSNGSAFDVLYVTSATGNSAGTISKFSLVDGTWTANGTYTTNFGGFGLAAADNGNGAVLYVTTGAGALTNNRVIKLSDVAGFNATIDITTANNVTLYTATDGKIIKGIDFAPKTDTGGVNQPPVNTLPAGPLAVNEDTAKVVSGASIADLDAGIGNVQVTLSVLHGILNVSTSVSGGITAGEVTTNGTASIVITSTLAKINATLANATGLTYTPTLNYNGADTLTMVTNDQGNSGTGGAKTDTDTLAINVAAVNDAPVNTVPAGPLAVNEDTNLIITGLSVADLDAGTSNVSVTLSALNGTVTVSTVVSGGIVAGDVTGNGTSSVVITGTLAKINATLADAAGVTYKGNSNFTGSDTFTMLTSDLGNTGSPGALTDSDNVIINIAAVNDPPVNTVPGGSINVVQNSSAVIAGLSITDADAASGLIKVTLSVLHGTLTVNTGVSGGVLAGEVATNGTASVQITSTLAKINATLAHATGLTFAPTIGYIGPDTLTIVTDDQGNTGSPGAQTDTDTVNINVTPNTPNQAPVNTVPAGPLAASEDLPLVISGISVADPDASSGFIKVTFSVLHGTVTVNTGVSGGVLAGEVATNGTASVQITSTLAKINATLAHATGLTYQGVLNYNGPDTLTMITDDQGNSGTGGALTDTDTVTINVSAVNDAPVNTLPAGPLGSSEDLPFVISGISIADVDAASGTVSVTLSVLNGTLTINTTVGGGLGAGDVTGNGTSSAVLTGTLAQINATLANATGLTYQGNLNYNGPDTLTVLSSDGGSTGSGGTKTDTDTVGITVAAVNDAPINSVPAGPLAANEDAPLVIAGLSITDVDAASGTIRVTVSVLHGTLTVNTAAAGGVVSGEVGGNGTATVVLTSTLAKINATLAHATGLTYQSILNYAGPDTLTLTTEDQGSSGSGGPKTDTDTVAINVAPTNDGPVNTVPGAQVTNKNTALIIAGISIADIDAGTGNIQVTLSVLNGTLTVGVPISGGVTAGEVTGNGTASVVVTSTLAKINATLAGVPGLIYQPNSGYGGPDTLTVLTDDLGNTGSPGALTDTDTVAITVLPDNLAPINNLPTSPVAANEDVPLVLSGISITDLDAGSGAIKVTFSILHGTLTVNTAVAGGVTAGQVTGNGTASAIITSTLAQINATLANATGLTYLSSLNYNGPDTLAMVTNDQGNTGTGGAKTDTDTLAISVVAVNDAPVNTVPGSPVLLAEDTSASIQGLSIADIDAPAGSVMSATLSVANGRLVVNTTVSGGVPIAGIAGNNSATVVLTGTIPQINATLAHISGLVYVPNANFFGTDALIITTSDLGNTGTGGAQIDTDTRTLTVIAVNDGPTHSGPSGPLVTNEDVPRGITGFAIADPDANSSFITVSLSVQHGTLAVQTTVAGGVTAPDILGNGSGSVLLTATLAKINATLASLAGVIYTPTLNYVGSDTLTILTNDVGNVGTPGPLTATSTVALTINRVGDIVATAADKGGLGIVHVFDAETQQKLFSITPYGTSYRDGVQAVLADTNGDGHADIIVTAPGKSKTQVTQIKVFSALTGAALTAHPFHNKTPFGAKFKNGANLALGDLGGDGDLDLVLGQAVGNQVIAIDGADGVTKVFGPVKPFGGAFKGGIRVAVGDVDTATAGQEVVVASGKGRKAQVKVLDGSGAPGRTLTFSGNYSGGLFIDVAQLNGTGAAEIIVSAAIGKPRVKIYDGSTNTVLADLNAIALGYAASYAKGIRVALGDADDDGVLDMFLAPGAGAEPRLRAFENLFAGVPTEIYGFLPQDAFTGFTVSSK